MLFVPELQCTTRKVIPQRKKVIAYHITLKSPCHEHSENHHFVWGQNWVYRSKYYFLIVNTAIYYIANVMNSSHGDAFSSYHMIQQPRTDIFRGYSSIYSEIPLLRPPKIKTSCLLKTLFAKFKLSCPSFSTPWVHLIRDHIWDCPKVVLKTTFGQFQRWS